MNRLPYGIASAPAVWQRIIEQILSGIPNTLVYLDDILITGETETDRLNNLETVLNTLNEYGRKFQESLEYCSHVIDRNGLHMADDKMRAINDAPEPLNILMADPELPLRLSWDSSSYGIGAVLSHVDNEGNERPIYFISWTLSLAENKWESVPTPCYRIHMDFAGPFMNNMFLIIVDSYSNCPEVIAMNSTTTQNTIKVLREIYLRHGIPEKVVTDKGPQFVSNEMKLFFKSNVCEIQHLKSAPYYPATKRFVRTLKISLRSMKNEGLI
ncbi:K02A2.6-like [Cordylochernes scorpioides]|uniref:K02A2.6-like n=1 Tax=Cordylochernes scorpioides TaxID=51811 RepID=A0ABY6KBM7_9ARAC|nr:K02A2.6-like [Cordylochernes scorpioides]